MTSPVVERVEIKTPHVAGRWRIYTTAPAGGSENMRMDEETLERVMRSDAPPTLRFFRWLRPTLSFGRLQRRELVQPLIPTGWDAVQRPTGGGIVFHRDDLSFSLTWRKGEPPLCHSLKAIYPWIHQTVREALAPWRKFRMAAVQKAFPSRKDFQRWECFQAPVADDLIDGTRKVVGGAIARRREGFLYQGSIQAALSEVEIGALADSFETRFAAERAGHPSSSR